MAFLQGFAKPIAIAVLAVGAGLIVSRWLDASLTSQRMVEAEAIAVPAKLSQLAEKGRTLFDANCAVCHGEKGTGTEQGPPFIHEIYNPGHHPDAAFMRAPRTGVRAHHWKFGDMPPVEGVSDDDLLAIVKYVRELQQANGIVYKPHVM